MSLKGSFNWFYSKRQGGKKAISFTLLCDNLFQSETFDCAIIDSSGQVPPQIRRQITLKAKQYFRFDYDTCDWNWCAGDFFAILGKNDTIDNRWNLDIKVYGMGECPECHGTKKCMACNGNGVLYQNQSHMYLSCTHCNGTGICQTCYVPIRQIGSIGNNTTGNANSYKDNTRQLKINALRELITDLQSKIEKEEWSARMMQIRGIDSFSRTAYSSQSEIIHIYKKQLINALHELQQLENIR